MKNPGKRGKLQEGSMSESMTEDRWQRVELTTEGCVEDCMED
jgi:hypothetical protein